MGADKALVPFAGVPMALCVADALRSGGCRDVVAVGGDAHRLAALGLRVVPDRWPGEGPLGGVVTALEHFAAVDAAVDGVVVVACDLPALTGATVQALVAALREHPAALAAAAVTDRVQPLCVAWRPSASARLRSDLTAGARKLHDSLNSVGFVEVSVNHQDVHNVNTPDDLAL